MGWTPLVPPNNSLSSYVLPSAMAIPKNAAFVAELISWVHLSCLEPA